MSQTNLIGGWNNYCEGHGREIMVAPDTRISCMIFPKSSYHFNSTAK